MAAESPISSYPSATTDEFEELENFEFDEDVLRELLGEEPEEVHPLPAEADFDLQLLLGDCSANLEIKEQPQEDIDFCCWLETMEVNPIVMCSDIAVWNVQGEEPTELSHFYNGTLPDELDYCDLWQEH